MTLTSTQLRKAVRKLRSENNQSGTYGVNVHPDYENTLDLDMAREVQKWEKFFGIGNEQTFMARVDLLDIKRRKIANAIKTHEIMDKYYQQALTDQQRIAGS